MLIALQIACLLLTLAVGIFIGCVLEGPSDAE